jgi:hypothetical protein
MSDVWSMRLEEAAKLVYYGAECRACKGPPVLIDLESLIPKLGPDFPVKNLRERLKCSECGSKQVITGILFRNNTATDRLIERWIRRQP